MEVIIIIEIGKQKTKKVEKQETPKFTLEHQKKRKKKKTSIQGL